VFDRRLISNFDWTLFLVCLFASILGIVNLYSAGSVSLVHISTPYYIKQAYWLLVAIVLSVSIILIDYQLIVRQAYLLHCASLVLLIIALFWGGSTAGTHRWLRFGGFSFQPSEMAKITLVLALSFYFSGSDMIRLRRVRDFIPPVLVSLVTFILVFLGPDLGTSTMLVLVFISFLFFILFNLRYVASFLVSGIVLLPIAWLFIEEYQKKRVLSFFNPSADSLRTGYQAIQSKIAIGSGMVFGKGFLAGTQSQLRFLPEQHTDFAFSVWAEEWGFVGSAFIVLLLFLIISKGLKVASQSRDRLGSFLSIGLVLILFWQMFINVAMVVGLLPVVGVPLPFFSYGGSSLVSSWVVVGMLLNIRMRKFTF